MLWLLLEVLNYLEGFTMQTTPTAVRVSSPGAPGPETVTRAAVWQVGLVGAGAATLANLAVLLTASAVGADMVVRRTADEPGMVIGGAAVMATTLMPILVATSVLAVVRRRHNAWPVLGLTGLAVGLLTVPLPFTMVSQTGTQIALGLMHIVTGVAWFLIVSRAAARWVV